MNRTLVIICCALFAQTVGVDRARADARPNIVFILCDDLGYGDVKCLNPDGKIATPRMDRLASQGMKFTDAHTGSSVCTPTRYGVMTGRYAWRTPLQKAVLGGLSPRLIEPGRLTVAEMLRANGYYTACIGKWHLGMDWAVLPGKDVSQLSVETPEQVWSVDFSKPIANGPTSVGFDTYFGIAASLDMVPYAYIENDRVTELPSVEKSFPMVPGNDQKTTRKGPATADFDITEVLPTFTKKVVATIDQHAESAKNGKPFFLYVPLNSPHTPIAPSKAWQGKSGMNGYADFVMETDASIGLMLDALDRNGLADNTLVIVTSDNGCSPSANFDELATFGHDPSYVFRGHKADIFDGGHRVPFLVRWPARVKPGTESSQLLCLTDFMATCAQILRITLPDNAGEDSISFLPVLLGNTVQEPPGLFSRREAIVHHSVNGSFAIRRGPWKLELCPGSGGWSAPHPVKDDTSGMPLVQLYNLKDDVAETQNVQDKHPEIVSDLTHLLETYVADGRSTPGQPQKNAVEVDVWKAGREAHQPRPAKKKVKPS